MIGKVMAGGRSEIFNGGDRVAPEPRALARLPFMTAVLVAVCAPPVRAHPPLKASLAQVETRLARVPADAATLAAPGELLRLLGDGYGAEADLAAAIDLEVELGDVESALARLYTLQSRANRRERLEKRLSDLAAEAGTATAVLAGGDLEPDLHRTG